jgi:hypothetical protein
MKGRSKDIEFYRETMLKLQEEKALLQQKLDVLEEQLRTQNKSHEEETRSLRDLIESLKLTTDDLVKVNQIQAQQLTALTKVNQDLVQQLTNALSALKLSRGKRFAPTTEQSNLLNNRNTDVRSEEKNEFDGTQPPAVESSTDSAQEDASEKPKKESRKKKKSTGRKPSIKPGFCDEVVHHH